MERESRAESARRAFYRAVDRERNAIERHEAAAAQQDAIATQLEQQDATNDDGELRELREANAAHARRRADEARSRAARARARLIAEGVDPDCRPVADPDGSGPGPA